MENLTEILVSVLPPFLLLGVGAFARGAGWLRAEADASLSMMTIRILYPCFIFYHVLGSERKEIDENTLVLPGFGFLLIILGFGISWIVARLMKIDPWSARSFVFCSGIFNYGFFALPVALSIFGDEIIVEVILFNLGVEVAIWTIGILLLTSSSLSVRGLLNPPSVAVILALFVQANGGKEWIPAYSWEVIEMIGRCSIPMGLILIGGSFYQLLRGFQCSKGYRVEISALLVRNFIFPMLVLAYLSWGWLPDGIEWLPEVLMIQAAMPAGIFAVVTVGNYKGDRNTAMRAIIVTMVASVATLPFWLACGLKVLD